MPAHFINSAWINVSGLEYSNQIAQLIVRRVARIWKSDDLREAFTAELVF
jgi:hypothetical protein